MKKLAIGFFAIVVTAAAGSLSVPSGWLAVGDQGRGRNDTSGMPLIDGPALEAAMDTSAIVRWTTNSIDGTAVRYGVVRYGVDPRHLDQVAKSSNRWNKGLPTMTYRVQLDNLEPGLTYYYTVEATDAKGQTLGTDTDVHQFIARRS